MYLTIIKGSTLFLFSKFKVMICGPGSSVSIVTDYGMDVPGIESR